MTRGVYRWRKGFTDLNWKVHLHHLNLVHLMIVLQQQFHPLETINKVHHQKMVCQKEFERNFISCLSGIEVEVTPSCFRCFKCSKTFLAENSLRIHVRRHMNKTMGRYMCDVCGQTFSQKSGQISHLRIHTKEKPFQCDVCDKTFSDFSTFTKHRRVHSGEKPYSCSICFRKFSQSGNLHRHFRVIHMKHT